MQQIPWWMDQQQNAKALAYLTLWNAREYLYRRARKLRTLGENLSPTSPERAGVIEAIDILSELLTGMTGEAL